jgi:hypothetical protein
VGRSSAAVDLAGDGDGRAFAGASVDPMKPRPIITDGISAWREVRWIILRVLSLLALIFLYVMSGGPLPHFTRSALYAPADAPVLVAADRDGRALLRGGFLGLAGVVDKSMAAMALRRGREERMSPASTDSPRRGREEGMSHQRDDSLRRSARKG